MKLSIIIPVYNVEKFIKQCILSVCSQELDNIEIIVVNDGSIDDSINIIKQIDDKRIKLVTQVNRGLSSARNSGLAVAQGEYIAFLDGDDYIAFNSAYKEMYEIAKREDSEIVSGNYICYFSEKLSFPINKDSNVFNYSPMESENFYIKCLKEEVNYAPVWSYIFRKSFLLENKLSFKEGIFHEDEEFTPRALLKSEKVSIYNKAFYVYRQRENSITNSYNLKRGMDLINTCSELDKLLCKIDNSELRIQLGEYISKLTMLQIYKFKICDIDNDIKEMLKRNTLSTNLVLRSKIISFNIPVYILIEYLYRKFRGIKT